MTVAIWLIAIRRTVYTKMQHSFTPIVFNTDSNLSSDSLLPMFNKSSHWKTINNNKLYILNKKILQASTIINLHSKHPFR